MMREEADLLPRHDKNLFVKKFGKYLEASAKTKKVNGNPDKINELILKTKADLKERPDNI